MLAELTIPDSQLQVGFWTFVTYIFAAIAWGVRVEMRLAALAREDKAQAEHTARNEMVMQKAIEKLEKIHDSVLRIETEIKGQGK